MVKLRRPRLILTTPRLRHWSADAGVTVPCPAARLPASTVAVRFNPCAVIAGAGVVCGEIPVAPTGNLSVHPA